MFVTSVAYDYYKSYTTAFIEINGQPETIFGKPPTHYIIPIINVLSAVEGFCFLTFWIFVLIHLINQDNLFSVMVPLYIYYSLMCVGMIALSVYWVIMMFKYVRSIVWILAFLIGLPIIFFCVLLFFGLPLLTAVLFPLQKETTAWQTPTIWDTTFYICLTCVGATLKGFIRPTEDDENPYSTQKSPIVVIIFYFLFLFFFVVWIFLFTCKVDQRVPWINITFDIYWWVIMLPFFFGLLIPLVIFSIKAAMEFKTIIKHGRDSNGDSIFKAVHYTGLITFILLVALSGLIGIITFEYPDLKMPTFLTVVPLIFAWLLITFLSLLPFVNFFQKKTASGNKGRREMLTAL
eukprot:gene1477-12095_t